MSAGEYDGKKKSGPGCFDEAPGEPRSQDAATAKRRSLSASEPIAISNPQMTPRTCSPPDETERRGRETYDGGALEDGADNPNPAREDDGPLAAEEVGKLGDREGTDEGARRHGGDDGTLSVGTRVAEGVLVGVIGQDAGHGRDVQSEEATADTCERT